MRPASLTAATALISVAAALAPAGCGGDGGEDVSISEPRTAELERALDAAYAGAATFSAANDNYFARDQRERTQLAAAVSVALRSASPGTGSGYATKESDLGLCTIYQPNPTVRVRATGDGSGLTISAADTEAVLRLTYEPGSDVEISGAERCTPAA